jgi:alpha-L-fucosidase 2
MDAFVPSGPGPFPAVIMVHGGGWETGDKVTSIAPLFEPLAKAGFAWFSIDYRLSPYVHISDELDDLRASIRFVRAHAGWFHVDPNRIAILGESSAGHLVSEVVSEPCPDCLAQAVVSFYGVYDLPKLASLPEWKSWVPHWFENPTPEALRDASPISHASPQLPPVLLIQGTEDSLYPGTMEYAARLRETGVRYKLILVQGAPHGIEDWEGHPEWMFYKHEMVEWLRDVLKLQPGASAK